MSEKIYVSSDLHMVTINDTTNYYSQAYLKNEMEKAFQAGMWAGAEVKVVVSPISPKLDLDNIIESIWKKINEVYSKNFIEGRVWHVGPKEIKKPTTGGY
jgi:hypothetical protein